MCCWSLSSTNVIQTEELQDFNLKVQLRVIPSKSGSLEVVDGHVLERAQSIRTTRMDGDLAGAGWRYWIANRITNNATSGGLTMAIASWINYLMKKPEIFALLALRAL